MELMETRSTRQSLRKDHPEPKNSTGSSSEHQRQCSQRAPVSEDHEVISHSFPRSFLHLPPEIRQRILFFTCLVPDECHRTHQFSLFADVGDNPVGEPLRHVDYPSDVVALTKVKNTLFQADVSTVLRLFSRWSFSGTSAEISWVLKQDNFSLCSVRTIMLQRVTLRHMGEPIFDRHLHEMAGTLQQQVDLTKTHLHITGMNSLQQERILDSRLSGWKFSQQYLLAQSQWTCVSPFQRWGSLGLSSLTIECKDTELALAGQRSIMNGDAMDFDSVLPHIWPTVQPLYRLQLSPLHRDTDWSKEWWRCT